MTVFGLHYDAKHTGLAKQYYLLCFINFIFVNFSVKTLGDQLR